MRSAKSRQDAKDMLREDSRNPGDGYCIQILTIDGKAQEGLSQKSIYIENISRGGFRFVAAIDLQIDTRIKVLLRFPDERTQEVLGRICYCVKSEDDETTAYGFSVVEGFYTLYPNIASS